MMRFANGNPASDPFGLGAARRQHTIRQHTIWEVRARKALDLWAGTMESSVAAAIEQAYMDGLKRAADFVEEKGQGEFAVMIKNLVSETAKA